MRAFQTMAALALMGAAVGCNAQPAPQPHAGAVTTNQIMIPVRFSDDQGRPGPVTNTPKIVKTDAEWRKLLTDEQYRIARNKGTEPAFCGTLLDQHKPGVYYCVCCGLPLFTSEAKFNSGTGWPSFFQPFCQENVLSHADNSYGMQRTEILCAQCDGHLGHVFDDGPPPTGRRYCLNSASLIFKENTHLKDATKK